MMAGITIKNLDLINKQGISELINSSRTTSDLSKSNSVLKISGTEDCRNFEEYTGKLGLSYDSDILILSSEHHYYYDAEEMVNIKTVINLKELNQIKNLKDFLHSIFHIIPADCNFIGCFVNNRKQSGFLLGKDTANFRNKKNSDAVENGIVSNYPLLNMLYNMIDSKTNKYLSDRSVSLILGEHGFKVIDVTEIDSLTYFCAKRLRSSDK
jgi:hypothetical protein